MAKSSQLQRKNSVTTPPLRAFFYDPPSAPLPVLHADDQYVIVDKPAGLLSVPGKSDAMQDCLESRMQALYPNARIIHRLDMSTSGIMVMAMNSHAHRHIGLQFEKRQTRKTYLAHVWGHVVDDAGHINLPLICDWPNRPLQKIDHEIGKPAQTDWNVLGRSKVSTYVKLSPITGRSHQLRVHMRELGHPILGDRLYAPKAAFEAANRLMLHAHTLAFRHPDGGEPVSYTAQSPFIV